MFQLLLHPFIVDGHNLLDNTSLNIISKLNTSFSLRRLYTFTIERNHLKARILRLACRKQPRQPSGYWQLWVQRPYIFVDTRINIQTHTCHCCSRPPNSSPWQSYPAPFCGHDLLKWRNLTRCCLILWHLRTKHLPVYFFSQSARSHWLWKPRPSCFGASGFLISMDMAINIAVTITAALLSKPPEFCKPKAVLTHIDTTERVHLFFPKQQ